MHIAMDSKMVLLLFVLIAFVVDHQVSADYIWHNDEIPYEGKAACYRGHSYYSNSPSANETDIDVGDDVTSLLDYKSNTCSYCVCSVSGRETGCISRHVWYCEYFRMLREEGSIRDRYRILFQQDRPEYFSHISWRLRRKMDEGIYELIDTVGKDLATSHCVPFVSEYSDCTEENQCSGCIRCTCTASGDWTCGRVYECPAHDYTPLDDNALDNALTILYSQLKNKKDVPSVLKTQVQEKPKEDLLLDKEDEIERKIIELMTRKKRSVDDRSHTVKGNTKSKKNNGTVKFYHTVDEINEDTLQNTNVSGTLQAKKVDTVHLPKISRRTSLINTGNKSSNDPLHIEYNHAPEYPHITDNKIDNIRVEESNNILGLDLIHTNYTQKEKDKDLSRLIVNELKSGKEIIGSKHAAIMSNITFTPEKDSLTAMAYIAGNLLNKLWSMEKEGSEESFETDDLKHQKIADLLDLFKEPLTIRQELFLKNALEKLSEVIDSKKDVKNISLCDNIEEVNQLIKEASNSTWDKSKVQALGTDVESDVSNDTKPSTADEMNRQRNVTSEAISKLNNVLGLIKKFEGVNKYLNDLKRTQGISKNDTNKPIFRSSPSDLPKNEKDSINLYANILEKITKLLLPTKHKKVVNKIKSQGIFKHSDDIKKRFKEQYNLDLSNLTLSTKDKLVLDYLTSIKNTPSCLLDGSSNFENIETRSNIESDILLNLSEFFKIKSFVDLLKLLNPKQARKELKANLPLSVDMSTTVSSETKTTELPTTVTDATKQVPKTDRSVTEAGVLMNTKEKLKLHLKSILDDLIELQKEKGISAKEGEIKVADALPCIYNIINAEKEIESKILEDTTNFKPEEKIVDVFDSIKKEMQVNGKTARRNIDSNTPRAKSTVVWERVVKNINEKDKQTGRRSSELKKAKTYEEIKILMDQIEKREPNAYKNYAMFVEVPPAERLILLKTLEADIKQLIQVLGSIKMSLDTITDKRKELREFVNNAEKTISLTDKVIKNIGKPRELKYNVLTTVKPIYTPRFSQATISKPSLRSSPDLYKDYNKVKLSRDEILNQLIRNRVNLFLSLKESQNMNMDLENDPSYTIAKNIMKNLERGDYRLARDLYKVFVSTKVVENNINAAEPPKPLNIRRQHAILDKEPLIQFEDPKPPKLQQLGYRDQMVKQLLNMNSLRI